MIGGSSGLTQDNSVWKPYELFRGNEINWNKADTYFSALFIWGQSVTVREQAWAKRLSAAQEHWDQHDHGFSGSQEWNLTRPERLKEVEEFAPLPHHCSLPRGKLFLVLLFLFPSILITPQDHSFLIFSVSKKACQVASSPFLKLHGQKYNCKHRFIKANINKVLQGVNAAH